LCHFSAADPEAARQGHARLGLVATSAWFIAWTAHDEVTGGAPTECNPADARWIAGARPGALGQEGRRRQSQELTTGQNRPDLAERHEKEYITSTCRTLNGRRTDD
jgi:hypothetical protein